MNRETVSFIPFGGARDEPLFNRDGNCRPFCGLPDFRRGSNSKRSLLREAPGYNGECDPF